jgi:hypothetical protein
VKHCHILSIKPYLSTPNLQANAPDAVPNILVLQVEHIDFTSIKNDAISIPLKNALEEDEDEVLERITPHLYTLTDLGVSFLSVQACAQSAPSRECFLTGMKMNCDSQSLRQHIQVINIFNINGLVGQSRVGISLQNLSPVLPRLFHLCPSHRQQNPS